MPRREIGFVVAEDEAPLRAHLVKKVLAADPGLVCLGTAADGEDALALVTRTIPQILITDIRMPVLDGLELIERSLQLSPSLCVVIVSGFDDFKYAQRALRLGVSDFLLKPVQPESLASALANIRSQIEARTRGAEREYGVDEATNHLAEYADSLEHWLKTHLSEDVRLEELCLRWRLKPSYAVKIYKKRKGLTPMRHLTVLRIRRACELLATTDALQIKQVADLVGYSDPLYFSRVFARETGSTPSQWRERNFGGADPPSA